MVVLVRPIVPPPGSADDWTGIRDAATNYDIGAEFETCIMSATAYRLNSEELAFDNASCAKVHICAHDRLALRIQQGGRIFH